MAILPRCLCFLLTLWMVGLSPSAATRIGSLKSSPWWGTSEAQQINRTAAQLRGAGEFAAAEKLYQQGYRLASRQHDGIAVIRLLMSIGGVRLEQRQYRAALEPLLEARRLAASRDDRLDLGAVDGNLSSLYLQMWDVDAALRMAEEGLTLSAPLPGVYYRHHLLLQIGRLHQALEDGKAEAFFQKGIEAARERGDLAQEARGWDLLGEEWLQNGQLRDSERALDEAFRMRVRRLPADIAFSYGRLGALKLAQGDLDAAGRLTELASLKSAFPEYLLRHQRGQIRLAEGNRAGALKDFEAAAESAETWRREVLPAVSTLTSTNVALERRIFDSLVETAAAEAVRTGNPRWAAESFEALESNRAASLRETMVLADVWRKKLPAEYWDVLGQLRAEESRRIREKTRGGLAESLKGRLMELEAGAGLRFNNNNYENFLSRSSLIHFQQGLSKSEILLSFYLGEQHSYLWAVTRDSVQLYPLGPGTRIRADATRFREAVRVDHGEARGSAERLYGELFGRLGRRESGKQAWLLSLDDALLETPVAALIEQNGAAGRGVEMKYLVEKHSLQVVPGALLLNSGTGKPTENSWFLGVGNPVYNTADTRWEKPGWYQAGRRWLSRAGAETELSTLVASAAEVESSARSWSGSTVVLEGSDARRAKFLALAARGPGVIHLATHVMTPPTRSGEALIAFGLESNGQIGYLANSEVVMMGVPGAIVSMTGCQSGGGEYRAGAGLIGLTRAWLMAGARAVISTKWPVRDSQGEIFASFYRYLRSAPPAEAMRESQVEMIHSGTWRASPSYWASYQVTGGHSLPERSPRGVR